MARGRRGFYSAGGRTIPSSPADAVNWEPKVDKNPFYRTMDIFNGVFHKDIKLAAGKTNCTDLKTIFVDFGELRPSRIKHVVREGKDSSHAVYELECGHEWDGKTTNKDGSPKVPGKDWGMCGVCGAEQVYRGFEHEWQHIIFKSDLTARRIFCEQYADQLLKQAPGVDREGLVNFLSLLVNAFDDIRVNSLWEKVYPGSAYAIWDRWRYLTLRMGDAVNTSFLAFVFAVAFNLPTSSKSDFAAMRPVIEWAVKKVKYRGFANMLIDVRVVVDKCMGTILGRIPPPNLGLQPPPSPDLQRPVQPNHPSNSNSGVQDGVTDSNQKAQGKDNEDQDHQDQQQEHQGADQDVQGPQVVPQQAGEAGPQEDEGGEEPGSNQGAPDPQAAAQDGDGYRLISQIPSAKDIPSTEQEKQAALERLIDDPVVLDEKEEHSEPSDDDLQQGQNSQTLRVLLSRVFQPNTSDINAIEDLLGDDIDADMQRQLDQLQSGIASKSTDSQLTGNAKARITIIDVTRDGKGDDPIELDEEEQYFIQRMRSAFYRTMGRQKAKRGPSGNAVDVQALIQYRSDHQDPNVFENEDVNQGFGYSVLCDMSGSMMGTFPVVTHAVEMLKQALKFPFVVGNLWGFRGSEKIPGRFDVPGEVWMYRYARDVNWYTGITPFRFREGFNGIAQVPVRCGGITPMNSALNVVSTHLARKMPSGMAKRLFLLTDGAPMQTKVSGAQLPEFMLRQFVAKEIRDARKHGIQVYTIVIGQHSIDEERCLQMFGPRRFWRRVGQDRVGTVLSQLVLANFSKYIKARS